ncbi:hypothetical protein D3C78_1422470 [compost metagenome]
MQAVLPVGGRDAQIAVLQIEQVQRIAAAHPRLLVDADGKLGIEAEIGPLGLVEVLAEVDQPCIREGILGVQGLAPPRVCDYDIRPIAPAPQIQQQPEHLLSMQHRILEGAGIRMGLGTG